MLKIHSLPESVEKSKLFEVSVNGIFVVPEFARVSAMPFNRGWPGHQRELSQTEESAFISFESDEKITLDITSDQKIETAVIRPLSKNIEVHISDNTVHFELTEFGSYVLEINGMHSPLTIFFNPVRDFKAESEKDAESGRKVFYYGKGVHNIGNLEIESDTTVTIDAGAIVYGNISAFSAENIKINGYGVLDGSCEIRTTDTRLLPVMRKIDPEYPFFENDKEKFDAFLKATSCLKGLLRFYFSKNVICEGVILRDSSTFCVVPAACDNVVIDNIKLIGMGRYNCDGIDIFNSSDIIIKNSFLRNFDDAMVIKGIAGWDFRNNENITVDNCVIWCDWGGSCEIGAETNAEEFKNILFKNCNLIHNTFGGMMRIQHYNRAKIHNITYENMHCEFCKEQMNPAFQKDDCDVYIYEEGTYQPRLIDLIVMEPILLGRDDIKGQIFDINFKDIHLYIEEGVTPMPEIRLSGLDENCSVTNIKLQNFYINGKRVGNIEELNPVITDFADKIKYE